MSAVQSEDRARVENLLSESGGNELDETSRAWVDRLYRGGEAEAAADARSSVEQILTSEAFLDSNRNWFMQLLEDLLDREAEPLEYRTEAPSSGSPGAFALVKPLLIGLLVVVVVGLIVMLISQRLKDRRQLPGAPATAAELVASRVQELRQRARAAEAAGDWVEALRLDFFALVVGLGERGDLDYRDAWTNRELLERGAPNRAIESSLRPVVKRLDAHSFGHLPSGPDEVREFSQFCDRLLEGGA